MSEDDKRGAFSISISFNALVLFVVIIAVLAAAIGGVVFEYEEGKLRIAPTKCHVDCPSEDEGDEKERQRTDGL